MTDESEADALAELVAAPEPVAEIVAGISGPEPSEPEEPAEAGPGDAGYVPMSEWLDDFDRR